MRNKYPVALLPLALVIVAFSGCAGISPGPEITETFDAEYAVGNNTILKVTNVNGYINIDSWDGDVIKLEAVKSTRYGENELKKVEMMITEDDNELIIETRYQELITRVSVNMNIKVPGNVTVDFVKTSNGAIWVSGTKGDIEVTSSNGEVIVRNVDGYVKASTKNGRIEVRGTSGIDDLKTLNGEVHAEIFDIKDDTEITSQNGGITAYVNPSLNVDIEMKTSNGRISTHDIALNTTIMETKYLEGKLGNGGHKIYMSTTNGNVNLDRLVFNTNSTQ